MGSVNEYSMHIGPGGSSRWTQAELLQSGETAWCRDQTCHLDVDGPTLFASNCPSPYIPELHSNASEREASIWLPVQSYSSPSCMLRKASSSCQQDLGASPGPRANCPTSSKVLRGLGTSRLITEGRECSWQTSLDAERNPENIYKKLAKMGKTYLWPRYTKILKSRDLSGPDIWENKGLGKGRRGAGGMPFD